MTLERPRTQAVLFDLDGTLANTHDLILASMRHATSAVLGVELPEEVLMARVGTPLEDQMLGLAGGDPERGALLTTTYREHNHRMHDELIRPFPGVAEALAFLREAGLRLAVVTSKRRGLAQRGIECVGLAPLIEFVVGSEDTAGHKPDPDPVLLGCERMGLEPARCVYVGDSPFDIAAGNAAGCVTVAVTWGMFGIDVLKATNPTYLCASPADLPGLCHNER